MNTITLYININLMIGTVNGKKTIYNPATLAVGGIIRKDSAGALTESVDGNYSLLQVGASGGLKASIVDASGNQITSFGSPSTIADYRSPKDFTATFTTTSTLTLTGLPFTLLSGVNVVYIKVRKSATNLCTVYVNGAGGYSFGHSAGVLTVYKDGVASAVFTDATDMLEIGINDQQKAYDPTTDTTKVINQSPDRAAYVIDSLVDTTNVAAGTTYYPSATGMSMDGFSALSISGKLIDADNTTTLTIEGSQDEDSTNADWVDITKAFNDDNAGVATSIGASIVATSATKTFAISRTMFNYNLFRLKLVTGDSTNTVILKARRMY